jgi:hypothetical protein
MKTEVNIDTLLAQDSLELTLNGKKYVVKDVELASFLQASTLDSSSENTVIKQLSMLMGVSEKELAHIGFRAALLVMREIRDWVTGAKDALEVDAKSNP